MPIYKKKGSPEDANNYRGITLLSCIGKTFTALLNKRISVYMESSEILLENQAGFRKEHSTTDHVFLIKCLIDIYLGTGRKLYAAFIDYAKAFDTVWRVGLWRKMIECGINGKIMTVIFNLYKGIKSRVLLDGSLSEEFSCNIGVRQGENLSPLLFSIFVNDLQDFVLNTGCSPLNIVDGNELSDMLRLLVIMYADDTVLLAESPDGLQRALDSLSEYCAQWKLQINPDKSKVVMFCKRKPRRAQPMFTLNGSEIETVDTFKYLGIMFFYTGSFAKCRKHVVEQATRAMWGLLRKCRKLALPPSIQLSLFDQTVIPVLLFGCEVWGYEKLQIIEKLQLQFCKLLLRVKKSTPTCMVYGELGRKPLETVIKQRMIAYWIKLTNGPSKKYSSIMYKLCLGLLNNNQQIALPWLQKIKEIFDNLGLSNVWSSQSYRNANWLLKLTKQRINDQAMQEWQASVNASTKCSNYRIYKTELEFEQYLDDLPAHLAIAMCKFRTTNHRLPVELGRYSNIPRVERKCTKCQNDRVGDEFHFLFECPLLNIIRRKYLPVKFNRNPNTLLYKELMCSKHLSIKLSKFIKEGFILYYSR